MLRNKQNHLSVEKANRPGQKLQKEHMDNGWDESLWQKRTRRSYGHTRGEVSRAARLDEHGTAAGGASQGEKGLSPPRAGHPGGRQHLRGVRGLEGLRTRPRRKDLRVFRLEKGGLQSLEGNTGPWRKVARKSLLLRAGQGHTASDLEQRSLTRSSQ